ncbi:MAG: RrF2 family transcriptional regulator [Deltaproteobacteria bacterium]|nr:RrF2 family transcriptional regulator [Candidatus Zymogenaceae bacterium]
MRLTTLSRYGTRALFDIAYYGQGEAVRASEISKRQNISLNYIGQIFLKLKRAGLIKSHRGRSGGYVLSAAPEEITLLAIIEAVEGPIALVSCVNNHKDCMFVESCITHDVWVEASEIIADYFRNITLKNLIDQGKTLGLAREAS